MNTTSRVCFAALIVVGIQGAVELLKDRDMPTELARPRLQLEELPKNLGQWTSEEYPQDPEIFRTIGAEMAITRRYRSKEGFVDLHSDVFLKYGIRVLHPPELCFAGNGYTVENGDTVELNVEGAGSHPARLLTMTRSGRKVFCLYWYQFGDKTFWNGDDQRRLVRACRGQKTWPPMIKVMLVTDAAAPEEAAKRLQALAALVFPWTRDYR